MIYASFTVTWRNWDEFVGSPLPIDMISVGFVLDELPCLLMMVYLCLVAVDCCIQFDDSREMAYSSKLY